MCWAHKITASLIGEPHTCGASMRQRSYYKVPIVAFLTNATKETLQCDNDSFFCSECRLRNICVDNDSNICFDAVWSSSSPCNPLYEERCGETDYKICYFSTTILGKLTQYSLRLKEMNLSGQFLNRWKYYFGSYILGSQSIWSLPLSH